MQSRTKAKHPSWFKMKLERRELVRELSPETAVNVLLACWEFLETGEKSTGLSPIENVAFASFMPDMEEAWGRYMQRIEARSSGKGRPSDIDRYHTISSDTDTDTESETEEDSKRESKADKPLKRANNHFVPPTVEDVQAYCKTRHNGIDAALFVDFYETRGWAVGRGKMKNWKAAVRTWERRDSGKAEKGETFDDVI